MKADSLDRPFIVLDQNRLRSAESLRTARNRCVAENLRLLIPDGAFFEMSAGSKPLDTWRRSLELVAPLRGFVAVPRKITDLMSAELSQGHPCDELVNVEATRFLQGLLADLDTGNVDSLMAIIDGPLQRQMSASSRAWSNPEQNKDQILRTLKLLIPLLGDATIKRLRQSPEAALPTWLSSADGFRFVFQGLRHQGASEIAALRLSSEPSVSASFIAALAALALYWIAVGGLDSLPPKYAMNDLHDVEYTVLGSICDSLLTEDKRLAMIHGATKIATVGRARWFNRALTHGPEHA